MRRKAFLFSLLVIALLASCDRKARMAGLAEENIRMSMDSPDGFAITAISEPDSAFGVNYLSQHEVNGITAIMQSVTALIMDRTNNMTAFNPDDHYVMSLAERQMKAMTDLRTMVYKTNEKGTRRRTSTATPTAPSGGCFSTRTARPSTSPSNCPCHKTIIETQIIKDKCLALERETRT